MERKELPNSLVAIKNQPIAGNNVAELETLVAKKEKILPLPPGANPKLKNLVPYRGHKNQESRKKSLSNLRRPMAEQLTSIDPPQTPAGMVMPKIPALPPPARIMDSFKEKYIKAVLTKEEWDLFLHTWTKFLDTHQDYNVAEDETDLETICMEEVIKWRINLLRMKRPEKRREFDDSYNQSSIRQQRARENLAARRSDRLGLNSKGRNVTTNKINIAVIAGTLDEKKVLEMQDAARSRALADMDFLNGTKTIGDHLAVVDDQIARRERSVPVVVEEPAAEEYVIEEGSNDADTDN